MFLMSSQRPCQEPQLSPSSPVDITPYNRHAIAVTTPPCRQTTVIRRSCSADDPANNANPPATHLTSRLNPPCSNATFTRAQYIIGGNILAADFFQQRDIASNNLRQMRPQKLHPSPRLRIDKLARRIQRINIHLLQRVLRQHAHE